MFYEFEKELIKKEKADVIKNFHMVDSMYDEAVALGIIPMKDPLDGLEIDLKIAKVVNYVSEASR
ncbi:MAG: hypothetical protein HWN69_04005 [Desulfobacterales bacterium]|nr:hypothetical protein [Desulfobacterales bacterium]